MHSLNPNDSPDQSTLVEAGAHNVQIVRIELPAKVERAVSWFIPIVITLIMVVAGCALIMGLNLAKQDQMDRDFKEMKTQEWLKERRLMDREAYDIVNGKKLPGDDQYGPTGNIQRMKPKEK